MPSTFFSYGASSSAPQPTQLPDMSTLAEGMTPPSTDEGNPDANSYQPFAEDDESPEAPPAFETSGGYPGYASSDGNTPSVSAQQKSTLKGYMDGFLTARIFSLYSLSKLGFVGQYIADSLAALGPGTIAPGTESFYESGFMQGLANGEAVVYASLGRAP